MTVRCYDRGWDLFDKACQVMPLGSGTNSKAPRYRAAEPACFVRGKGCRLWDVDGHEYIDFRCSLGPVTLGYADDRVNAAVARQLEDGIVFSGPHVLEQQVADLLIEMIPAAEQVRFLKTGGEAMAAAIKLARAFTGRDRIVSSGYHGWLQTVHDQRGVPEAISQLTHTYAYGDLDAVRQVLQQYPGQVAAVTLSGSYPQLKVQDTFAQQLEALAREHGALLIVDEIVTGFRLAYGGWSQYYGVRPDLAVFSKGIANGMPISACLGRREVMQQAARGAVISSTFAGETLSLAAARTVLDIYRREPVIEHLWQRGEQLGQGLRRIFKQYRLPITLQGLPPCPRMSFGHGDAELGRRVQAALWMQAADQGVVLFDVPYVSYAHQASDIDEALQRLEVACSRIDLDALPKLGSPVPGSSVIGAAAS